MTKSEWLSAIVAVVTGMGKANKGTGAVSPGWPRAGVTCTLEAPPQGYSSTGLCVGLAHPMSKHLPLCSRTSARVRQQQRNIRHKGEDKEGLAFDYSRVRANGSRKLHPAFGMNE